MGDAPNSDTALLTEHLRYTPVSLLDDIINSINSYAFKATEAIEKGLLSASPADLGFITRTNSEEERAEIREKVNHEIENGVHQLETLLDATIDKNFDRLEIYAMRNILSVPEDLRPWVRLSHYEGLNFTQAPDAPTQKSITMLRRKLQETQKLHTKLVARTTENAETIAQLRSILGHAGPKSEAKDAHNCNTSRPSPLAILNEIGTLKSSSTITPLSTTISFAISQLPSLRSRLGELQPLLKYLSESSQAANPNLSGEGEEKSARRERMEYIEKQTRRHLERKRGLELGEQGEVVDGEWQGGGRILGRGEVENLERIMGVVAGEGRKAEKVEDVEVAE